MDLIAGVPVRRTESKIRRRPKPNRRSLFSSSDVGGDDVVRSHEGFRVIKTQRGKGERTDKKTSMIALQVGDR